MVVPATCPPSSVSDATLKMTVGRFLVMNHPRSLYETRGDSSGPKTGSGHWDYVISISSLSSSCVVRLSRVWLTAGLVLALTAALVGLASPAGAVAGYGDVPEGTWYTDAVQWATANDITGVAGSCFGPDTPVSRGETAVWIYNMENRPDVGVRHPFTDVTDASQNGAISWMADTGITTGTSPTTFAPV